ncbi:MAG: hypothetical protein WA364_15845, partial [Candidatus Nitrosopolaris sp.]
PLNHPPTTSQPAPNGHHPTNTTTQRRPPPPLNHPPTTSLNVFLECEFDERPKRSRLASLACVSTTQQA